MVRARPGNPTLRDSLDLADQPGKSSGWHGLLHRSHHGGGAGEGRGVACGARQRAAKLPLSPDSVFPLPTRQKHFP